VGVFRVWSPSRASVLTQLVRAWGCGRSIDRFKKFRVAIILRFPCFSCGCCGMVESRWVGEFDDVDLSREEVFHLIEEGLWALGFMIVEKDGENGRMVTRLKSSYADSFGSVAFKKNQKQVSISVSYEIITPELMEPPPDEKIVENEKTKLEDSWKNLIRMIDSLFSSGFIPLLEITINSCPNCGREIDRDSNFCKYCGHKVR